MILQGDEFITVSLNKQDTYMFKLVHLDHKVSVRAVWVIVQPAALVKCYIDVLLQIKK
jgi:hypothetical protein